MADKKPALSFTDGPLHVILSEHTGVSSAQLHCNHDDAESGVTFFPESDRCGTFLSLGIKSRGREVGAFLTAEQARDIAEKLIAAADESDAHTGKQFPCSHCGEADRRKGEHGIGRCKAL